MTNIYETRRILFTETKRGRIWSPKQLLVFETSFPSGQEDQCWYFRILLPSESSYQMGKAAPPSPSPLLHIQIHSLYTPLEKFQYGYQEQLIKVQNRILKSLENRKKINVWPDSQVSIIQGDESLLQSWRCCLPHTHKKTCIQSNGKQHVTLE